MKELNNFMNANLCKIRMAGMFVSAGILTVNTFAGTASDAIAAVVGIVLGIFFWLGVLLGVYGVGQLILAFKNEDGDAKSRASMFILAALALLGLETIVNAVISGAAGQSFTTNKDF